ncbi:hypothetical protein CLV56_3343 [Mumia flava]|uniref:Uncharacterized protein n=1 Tax=Mumia flava TaxID=1348852 RepID=A0A0B2B6U7_9ACTN|nr:hypothetical protein [Mumia flava]PJJ53843.1 hypothetical protein CLV56_3343 [Mumia flava]
MLSVVEARRARRQIARESGERVLAVQQDNDGTWHAGTPGALWLAEDGGRRRIPWESVHRLVWDAQEKTLSIEAEIDGEPVHRAVAMADAGRIVELGRERVEASILARSRRTVSGRRTGAVSVLARRSPAGGGPTVFQYVLDPGLTSDDPEVQDALAQALDAVREELGSA